MSCIVSSHLHTVHGATRARECPARMDQWISGVECTEELAAVKIIASLSCSELQCEWLPPCRSSDAAARERPTGDAPGWLLAVQDGSLEGTGGLVGRCRYPCKCSSQGLTLGGVYPTSTCPQTLPFISRSSAMALVCSIKYSLVPLYDTFHFLGAQSATSPPPCHMKCQDRTGHGGFCAVAVVQHASQHISS